MSARQREVSGERVGFLSFRLVMGVFALLLVAGIGLGVVIHRRYVAFERIAAQHVPEDAALVVRWEVEKVTLFEPTRRYLLPLLDVAARTPPAGESRRERLKRAAELDVGRDLREAVALFGPEPGDWALVLGGAFPETGVIDALEQVLRDEGLAPLRPAPDRLVLPGGFSVGRASDGVLLLASSPPRLDAVLPARPAPAGMKRSGAGALLVRADARGLLPDARKVIAGLGDVSRIEGRATTGPLVVELDVHYRDAVPTDVLTRGRRALVELMGPGAVPPVELSTEGEPRQRRVTFRIHLNDEGLERGVRRVADTLSEALGRGS